MKNYLTIFLIFTSLATFAQKITIQDFEKINKRLSSQFNFNGEEEKFFIIEDYEDTVAVIKNYSNGYAVISYKKEFYPLKAFSDKPLDFASPAFDFLVSLLKYDYKKQEEYNKKYPAQREKNEQNWNKWLKGELSIKADTVGPLLKSEYGQVNCHDENNHIVNVTNYYTPNHYAVGCVAITFATTMRYYNWPVHGQGTHTYTDDQNSSTGTYSADFDNTTYRWDLIQDKYDGVASTEESRQALGLLAFHAAISVDMDFENGGSTSNINRIPYAASHYFRYDMPAYATVGDPSFWDLVDESLQNNNPVQFAVSTSSGAGHAIVCDGIIPASDADQQYYHLNMGWWGTSNGWYLIQSNFNAGGYTIIDAAVFEMRPVPELNDVNYDVEQNIATVSWNYPKKIQNPVFDLQQKTGTDDWQTIATGLTDTFYTFTPDISTKYHFRVKTTENENWSEDISFDPSIEASKLEDIQFFPTLTKQYVNVQYKDLSNATIDIFSVNGSQVYHEDLGEFNYTNKKIDVSFLERGLYIASIRTSDKQKSVRFVFEGHVQ